MTNHCGTCTACCRVYAIPELEKPAGKWCQHCAIGKGCKTYDDRPAMCVEFKCLWLLSQQKPGYELPANLRPDRCKVIFGHTTNESIIGATTMPGSPLAWQRKDVRQLIDWIIGKGKAVAVGAPAGLTQTLISRDGQEVVPMTAPDKDGMQWRADR